MGLEPIRFAATVFETASSANSDTQACLVLPLGLEPRSSSNLEAMPGYKPGVLPIELKEHIWWALTSVRRRMGCVQVTSFALNLIGAGDQDRTGTVITDHGILSPGRLPIPPHRHVVRITGVEPARFSPQVPQTCVSANSTISA